MLAFVRPSLPVRTNNASNNPILYEKGTTKVQFNHPHTRSSDAYTMTHTLHGTKNGESIVTPPFHYHIRQSERFRVRKGVAHFYIGLDKEPTLILTAEKGKDWGTVAAQRYHRFINASETEDLVIDIQLDPEEYEKEARFFRNFFGYLDDCKTAGTAPSLFQLIVFLRTGDTPVAIPLPSEWLGVWVSWIFMHVVATWGIWILGYKESYPEYYDDRKGR